jgi:predicted metalloprotease
VNQDLQGGVVLRGVGEHVVRLQHLIERELMADELLGGQLVLRDELQQHDQGDQKPGGDW